MKSAVCTNYDDIDLVHFIEDMPQPKIIHPDDVLIQVRASSVCNIDVEICKGYGKKLRKLLCKYNNVSKNRHIPWLKNEQTLRFLNLH